jgi:hypothetical protein
MFISPRGENRRFLLLVVVVVVVCRSDVMDLIG